MNRGKIRKVIRPVSLERALRMLCFMGSPTPGGEKVPLAYRLDPGFNGGNDPNADHCGSPSYGDRVFTSDCVGFVMWCLGLDRLQPGFGGVNGDWLNCKSMIFDAERDGKYFQPRDYDKAEPADILITTSHVALILRPARGEFDHLVVDCSPRHGRKTAIGIGGPWSESCRVLEYTRFRGFSGEA